MRQIDVKEIDRSPFLRRCECEPKSDADLVLSTCLALGLGRLRPAPRRLEGVCAYRRGVKLLIVDHL